MPVDIAKLKDFLKNQAINFHALSAKTSIAVESFKEEFNKKNDEYFRQKADGSYTPDKNYRIDLTSLSAMLSTIQKEPADAIEAEMAKQAVGELPKTIANLIQHMQAFSAKDTNHSNQAQYGEMLKYLQGLETLLPKQEPQHLSSKSWKR